MAQIRYKELVPDMTYFAAQYPAEMFGTRQRASGFELHDPDGNYLNYIVVHGTGLKYKNGYLVGGTITGVEYKDGNGDDYLTVSHAKVKVTQKLDISDISLFTLYQTVEAGNDKIIGSNESDIMRSISGKNKLSGLGGDDTLIAEGRDTLSGGQGSDFFVFSSGEKVVITDFDAVGGGQDQDYLFPLVGDGVAQRIYQHRHNTVLDFGKGHTLTLVGVDRDDFSTIDDFKLPPIFENF